MLKGVFVMPPPVDKRQLRYAIAFVDETRLRRTTETPNSRQARLARLVRQLELQRAPGDQAAIGKRGHLDHPALAECFLEYCKRQGYAPSMPQQACSLGEALDSVNRGPVQLVAVIARHINSRVRSATLAIIAATSESI